MNKDEVISTWDIPPLTRLPTISPSEISPLATPIWDNSPPRIIKSGNASHAKLPKTPITAMGAPMRGKPATTIPITPPRAIDAARGKPNIANKNKVPNPAIAAVKTIWKISPVNTLSVDKIS